MTMPSLPDWLPWWVPIVIAIPLGLWVLTMMLMPFSVIGLKSRLEGIEERLDELQSEIRTLVLRLPESPAERVSYRQEYYDDRATPVDASYLQSEPARPPIPPQPRANDFIPRKPSEPAPEPTPEERLIRRDELRADRPAPSPRAEPRLNWRR
jgi:hypothetical protein